MASPLAPLGYVLVAYLALQVLLNLAIRLFIRRSTNRAVAALKGSFWATVVTALGFIAVSVLLHFFQLTAPTEGPPVNALWWSLAGIPVGVGLWLILVKARGLGLRLFGRGELIASEDAILRVPPHPRYIPLGVLNLTLVQPLGRELFMRGVLWPLALAELGWLSALLISVVIEMVFRMNIVWLLANVAYSLIMVGLYQLSGFTTPCIIAACINGLLHGTALAYMGFREAKKNLDGNGAAEPRPTDSDGSSS